MFHITARNVNDAFIAGIETLNRDGVVEQSRAGEVVVVPAPVMTEYERPRERVLFHPQRDANPFFHLMEALWMLAGRNDATWLDNFVSDFSSRFAEEDGRQHGAYGYRWRQHFDIDWEGHPCLPDQLSAVVRLLKTNPKDRRAVIAMWDPVADLGANKRDIPCNTHVYLRVREIGYVDENDVGCREKVLDITVCCRSNDAIWGAYGANAVHFSVLQEYLAARIGVGVGRYYQLSNNFHAYKSVFDKLQPLAVLSEPYERGLAHINLVDDPGSFDGELQTFFHIATTVPTFKIEFKNKFFPLVAFPMFRAHMAWRYKEPEVIVNNIALMPDCDWRLAAQEWFERRIEKRKKANASK